MAVEKCLEEATAKLDGRSLTRMETLTSIETMTSMETMPLDPLLPRIKAAPETPVTDAIGMEG